MNKIYFYCIGLLIVLSACNNKERFNWQPEVVALTNKKISKWLANVPFKNQVLSLPDRSLSDEQFVTSNVEQIFPFVKGIYDVDGKIEDLLGENYFYDYQLYGYEDPGLGSAFVFAGVLSKTTEVFLTSDYSETGNIILEGLNSIHKNYSASLVETAIQHSKGWDKSAVYWASTDSRSYLLLLHQMGQLVVQVAFPCETSNAATGLQTLKKVVSQLHLDIPKIENAIPSQLAPQSTNNTFWKDPFEGIYLPGEIIPTVYLKIANSPFASVPTNDALQLFQYNGNYGLVQLKIELLPEQRSQQEFQESFKDAMKLSDVPVRIFLEEEQVADMIKGVVHAYYKKNKRLKISYSYPSADMRTKKLMDDVLSHLKILDLPEINYGIE